MKQMVTVLPADWPSLINSNDVCPFDKNYTLTHSNLDSSQAPQLSR